MSKPGVQNLKRKIVHKVGIWNCRFGQKDEILIVKQVNQSYYSSLKKYFRRSAGRSQKYFYSFLGQKNSTEKVVTKVRSQAEVRNCKSVYYSIQ